MQTRTRPVRDAAVSPKKGNVVCTGTTQITGQADADSLDAANEQVNALFKG